MVRLYKKVEEENSLLDYDFSNQDSDDTDNGNKDRPISYKEYKALNEDDAKEYLKMVAGKLESLINRGNDYCYLEMVSPVGIDIESLVEYADYGMDYAYKQGKYFMQDNRQFLLEYNAIHYIVDNLIDRKVVDRSNPEIKEYGYKLKKIFNIDNLRISYQEKRTAPLCCRMDAQPIGNEGVLEVVNFIKSQPNFLIVPYHGVYYTFKLGYSYEFIQEFNKYLGDFPKASLEEFSYLGNLSLFERYPKDVFL